MNIPPAYKVTSTILALISEIDSLRLYGKGNNLSKHVTITIHRNSLLRSSLYSARIEGNQLSELTLHEDNADTETLEITNIIKALEYLESSQILCIDHLFIKKIHTTIGNNIFPEKGMYRTEMSGIFNAADNVVYMPPPPTQMNGLLDELFKYVNSRSDFPLITAFVAHLIFEKIHPFLDGNGRVGRVLIPAVLKSKNFIVEFPVTLEEYLDTHRAQYYDVLSQGLQNVESYLEFMLRAYLEQMKKTIEKLELQSNKPAVIQELTARQEKLYTIVREHTVVSLNFIARRFLKVPERTLRNDISKLIEKGLVAKVRNTKGVEYRISE